MKALDATRTMQRLTDHRTTFQEDHGHAGKKHNHRHDWRRRKAEKAAKAGKDNKQTDSDG